MKQAGKLLAFMLTALIVLGNTRTDFIKAEVIQKTGNNEEAVIYMVKYENYNIDASIVRYAEVFFNADTEYADGCIGFKQDGEWVANLYELTKGLNRVKTSNIQGSEYLQVQIWSVDAQDSVEGTVSIEQINMYDLRGNIIATIGDSQIDFSKATSADFTLIDSQEKNKEGNSNQDSTKIGSSKSEATEAESKKIESTESESKKLESTESESKKSKATENVRKKSEASEVTFDSTKKDKKSNQQKTDNIQKQLSFFQLKKVLLQMDSMTNCIE